jgi:hypothetical protein
LPESTNKVGVVNFSFIGGGVVLVVGILAVAVWSFVRRERRVAFGAHHLRIGPGITVSEAGEACELLSRVELNADARLARVGETNQLWLFCARGATDETQKLAGEVLAAGLSDEVFAGTAVEIHLHDWAYREIAVVPHRRRLGRRLAMNAAQLFYTDGVLADEAFQLATFLAWAGIFNDRPKVAQLERAGAGYEFRLAVNVDPLPPEMTTGAERLADDLSRHVFRGAPVTVRYSHGLAGTLRLGPPQPVPAEGESPAPDGPYRTEVFVRSEQAGPQGEFE